MQMFQILLIVGFHVKLSSQVPPTEIIEEGPYQDVGSIRTLMTTITGQLDKFNSLYLTRLDQRMASIASTLSSIDSNVKNLQERAHVWDTFQLHVAAWNEQIKVLDKKMDLLSREQEKFVAMDNKIGSLLSLEYKIDRVISKLDTVDDKMGTLSKDIFSPSPHAGSLYSEFATRGVLSTLKTIEKKIDRLQINTKVNSKKNFTKRFESEEYDPKSKVLIRCTTPPAVEEILNDISSKVDVLFDKSQDYVNSEVATNDEREVYNDSPNELKSDSATEVKLLNKFYKRLTQPNKRTLKALENIVHKVAVIDNTTMTIIESDLRHYEDLLKCCRRTGEEVQSFTNSADYILKRVESIVVNLDSKEDHRMEIIDSQMKEQRAHLTAILRSYSPTVTDSRKACEEVTTSSGSTIAEDGSGYTEVNILDDTENKPIIEGSREDDEDFVSSTHKTHVTLPTDLPTVTETITDTTESYLPYSSCDEVRDLTGVAVLGKFRDLNKRKRDFYTRYCDGSNGGGWTVIQRRGYFPYPRQNFSLSWEDYKNGFGDMNAEFWMGNEYIHRLTNEKEVTLRVELEDFNSRTVWAEYSYFKVDAERDNYALSISGYSGNASDSFSSHNGALFSTWDRTNDDAPPCCPCAVSYGGGWWFNSCFEANLNAPYYDYPTRNSFRGIVWEHWLGDYSLKATKMMIRGQSSEFDSSSSSEAVDPIDIPEDP